MAYLLKSQDKIVIVETYKTLTRREREMIGKQLNEINALSAIEGLIIDHQKAEFDMRLEDAAIFAESIIRLHALAPLLFICVIVSERNRFIIDTSVSLAASRGVPIRVFENTDEAMNEIAQQFPQIHLPRPDGKSVGNVTPHASREAATDIGCVAENSTCASDQYSESLEAIDKLRQSRGGTSQISGVRMLSPRESECLLAAAYGLTEKETARLLGISHNTVSVHIANCREKLDARNKLDAVVKGIGLIEQKIWCRLCSLGARRNMPRRQSDFSTAH